MYEDVIYSKEGWVGKLILNRPKKRNAISVQMQDAIGHYLMEAQNDDTIRAIHVSGQGTVFCSGADLGDGSSSANSLGTLKTLKVSRRCSELYSLRRQITKPMIVSVQGACLGMGLLLCLMANVVIVREDATFGLPEIDLGYAPLGIFPYLVAAVGTRKAVGFAMSGKRINADTALEWGIVDYKVTEQESGEFLAKLIQEIAAKDALAMGLLLCAANQIDDQIIGYSEDYGISLNALNVQAERMK